MDDSLNVSQRRAAEAGDGPVAIIAGPGTGKTKTLTERIRVLLSRGVPACRILALTFTKKAAAEMHMRLAEPLVTVATFHGLCFDLQGAKDSTFVSEPARLGLIKQLHKPAAFGGMSTRELGLIISRVKNMAEDNAGAKRLADAYDNELMRQRLKDFDDLLLQCRNNLVSSPALRKELQKRFVYILVDEFQDTNLLQYELLQLIRGTDNLFVIGDPQQSIYGFRGADGDIFARFAQDFPQANTVTLGINYRSAPEVVALANAVYPDRLALTADRTRVGVVKITEVLNEYSEAACILDTIQRAIGGSDLQRAVSDDERSTHRSLRDFAIIYRSRAVARAVQKACADSGIPCQVVGEGSPYDELAVQTIVQLLAIMVDQKREAAINGLSRAQIDALLVNCDVAAKPYAVAEWLVSQFGFELTPALRQFLGVLVQFVTIAAAVAYFDSIATHNFYDPKADAVTLMTIHASKGLEFSHVFLIAAEDGVLPNAKGDPTEERRLFYVAVTRARDELDILHARFRGGKKATVSQIVQNIPQAILPQTVDPALATDVRRAAKRAAKRAQSSLF